MTIVHRVEIFYIYPPIKENTKFSENKRMLDNHLAFVKRRREVDWYDCEFIPGSNPTNEIEIRLNRANIILFLMSADYYASDGYDKEVEIALSRHRKSEARVIPIIFRSCDWQKVEFGILSPLPRDGRGIFPGENEDEVCKEVQKGIDSVVDEWQIRQGVQQEIERADSYFKKEDYEKALSLYKQSLGELQKTSFEKDKADLFRKIGMIQTKYEQREVAREAYERAIKLFPSHPLLPIFYKEFVEILLGLGRWEEAIEACDSAIKLIEVQGMMEVEVAKFYEYKGVAFTSLRKFKNALAAFDKAIETASDEVQLWRYRGGVCSKLEDIKGVKRSYEKAIGLAPSNAYLHQEYGKILYRFHLYHEALGEYYKALSLESDFIQVYQNMSEVYTVLAKRAQEEYERRKKDAQ